MDQQLYSTLLEIPNRMEDKDEQVKSLRELRNSYYQKASEIQKQIDDRIIELHQIPDLNNGENSNKLFWLTGEDSSND